MTEPLSIPAIMGPVREGCMADRPGGEALFKVARIAALP